MQSIEIKPEIQQSWVEMAAGESRELRLALRGRSKHGGPELKAIVPPSKEPQLIPPSQELQ